VKKKKSDPKEKNRQSTIRSRGRRGRSLAGFRKKKSQNAGGVKKLRKGFSIVVQRQEGAKKRPNQEFGDSTYRERTIKKQSSQSRKRKEKAGRLRG